MFFTAYGSGLSYCGETFAETGKAFFDCGVPSFLCICGNPVSSPADVQCCGELQLCVFNASAAGAGGEDQSEKTVVVRRRRVQPFTSRVFQVHGLFYCQCKCRLSEGLDASAYCSALGNQLLYV